MYLVRSDPNPDPTSGSGGTLTMGIARCKIREGLNSVPSVYAEFGLPEAHRRALRRGSVDPYEPSL